MTNEKKTYFSPEPQLDAIDTALYTPNLSVGFLKGNKLTFEHKVVIQPDTIEWLVEHDITVHIERQLGYSGNFIDLDYADVGAEIHDTQDTIFKCANIIVQLAPLTLEELAKLSDEQVIITLPRLEYMSKEEVEILQEKHITAIALNEMYNVNGTPYVIDIIQIRNMPQIANDALTQLLLSILGPMLFNNHLRHTIQINPAILQAIYCYKGAICNQALAERLQLPYEDLSLWCWLWN